MRSKIHVPNWDGQPKVSDQPAIVSDEKFFWIMIEQMK